MSDNLTTELQSLSKLKRAGRLRYWRGTIEILEIELHAICDEIQAEHDHAMAATLGSENCARCAEDMGRYADSLCDPLKERIAELLRCLENDWNIRASWDGLRKFWCIELTEEGVRLRDAELNSRAERTCRNTQSDFDFMCSECGKCVDNGRVMRFNYCPNCGAKVAGE